MKDTIYDVSTANMRTIMKKGCYMAKQPKALKFIIMPVVLLLLATLIDLLTCNAGLLFLSKEKRTSFVVVAQVQKNTDENGNVVRTTLIIKPEGYIHKITASMPRSQDDGFLGYKVFIRKADMGLNYSSKEYMPPFDEAKDTVSIRATAEEIHFVFDEDISQINFMADNRIILNKRRIAIWYAGLMCGWLLLALRRRIADRLEIGFIVVACTIGLAYAVIMPAAVPISFDDVYHISRSFELVPNYNGSQEQIFLDITHSKLMATHDGPVHPFNTVEDNERYHKLLNDKTPASEDITPNSAGSMYDVGYVTQALGIWITRLLGLPLRWQIVAGRVGNLAMYTLVCYFALKNAKRYKAIFYTIALGPIALFTAASYSYDPTVIAFALLGFSLFFSELLTPDKPIQRSTAAVMLSAFAISAMPKAVYGVLLALPLFLPASKFETVRQKRWFKTVTTMAMLLILASFILPVLMGTSTQSDARIEGTSVSGQVSFMLNHPLTAIDIFLRSILSNSMDHAMLMQVWFPYLANNSSLYNAINPAMRLLFFGMLLFAIFTDHVKSNGVAEIKRRQRLGILMILIAGCLLIWGALYLSYTPVANNAIIGVQGRYYLPLIPLVAALLNMRNMSGGMNRGKYNLSIVACNAGGLFAMLVPCVI